MSAMVYATPCVVPVAEKYTTSVLPVVVTVLVASEEAAALDAASLEATEELLTLLAELPEQEASSRCASNLQKLAAGNFILHTKHASIYVKCRESQRTAHASAPSRTCRQKLVDMISSGPLSM